MPLPSRRAFEALPPGGALLAVDNLIDDGRRTATLPLAMSLTMLLEFGEEDAFDYSFEEFRGWAMQVRACVHPAATAAAGFQLANYATLAPGFLTLLDITPQPLFPRAPVKPWNCPPPHHRAFLPSLRLTTAPARYHHHHR